MTVKTDEPAADRIRQDKNAALQGKQKNKSVALESQVYNFVWSPTNSSAILLYPLGGIVFDINMHNTA